VYLLVVALVAIFDDAYRGANYDRCLVTAITRQAKLACYTLYGPDDEGAAMHRLATMRPSDPRWHTSHQLRAIDAEAGAGAVGDAGRARPATIRLP
jgi:hypothetical protein